MKIFIIDWVPDPALGVQDTHMNTVGSQLQGVTCLVGSNLSSREEIWS